MKNRAKSSTRRRREKTSVSLFPFLAVLICTMGVLILLLVIFTHQARLQAARATIEKNRAAAARDSQKKEELQKRIASLRLSRQKARQRLAETRLRLGIIEDHARRLADELRQLQEARQRLSTSRETGRQTEQIEAELAETRANIARVEAEIAAARREIKRQSRFYRPVIPYQGPHGTMRLPICVECRGDAIVLQPEGIALAAEDFHGPLGPENPLAAALRAAREHLLASLDNSAADTEISRIEPYPLLLIRPDGTSSYNVAREALKSWGPDFGYELIESDWKIAYGSPRPALAQAMQQAVDEARAMQARLAAAAPRHYPQDAAIGLSPARHYTTSAGGGGVIAYHGQLRKSRYRTPGQRLAQRRAVIGGPSSADIAGITAGHPGATGDNAAAGSQGVLGENAHFPGGDSIGIATSGGSDGAGVESSASSGSNSGGSHSDGLGSDGAGGESMLAFGNSNPHDEVGLHGSGDNDSADSGCGNSQGGASSSRLGNSGGIGSNSAGGDDPVSAGDGQAGLGAATNGLAAAENEAVQTPMNMQLSIPASSINRSAAENPHQKSDLSDKSRYADALRPGEWREPSPRQRSAKLDQTAAGDEKTSGHQAGKLAKARGPNWGLPAAAPRSTPLPRPILIECHDDRLVLVPERGLSGRRRIVLDGSTVNAIDEFVAAVWHYMDKSWGIAGNRMYWKPILKIQVAPGGEARFDDLKTLLADSGLEVRRQDNPLRR